MEVKSEQIKEIVNSFTPIGSVDTETFGLNSFKGDKLFSIILSDDRGGDHYVNFKDYPEEGIKGLSREVIKELGPIFSDPNRIWFLQNAKFDLHMLAREGIFIEGKIYDTMFLDRVHNNQHLSYKLADITKRWGDEKLDIVWKYITDNKKECISVIEHPEFMKTEEKPHFDKVPFKEYMLPYGCQDGRGTLNVGKKILAALQAEDAELKPNQPTQMQVVENEARLVKTLFNMEQRGIKLDIPYCQEALNYYREKLTMAATKFKELTGLDFVKGTTVFEEVFADEKDLWEKTEKGKWKWDKTVMENFKHPASEVAIEWAEAKKQFEYFANFLYYADKEGVLHPDFQQSGTVTGRLSCRDPNLQNLTNPDKYDKELDAAKYPVRRSFIPREGFFFAAPDYSQVEFRLMLDLAYANGLINQVLKGHDVHTATALLSGTSRKEAKTNNFLTAYGGGVIKLAQNLNKGKLKGTKHQLGAIYKQMFQWRLSEDEQKALPTVTPELRAHAEPFIRQAYEVQQSIFRAAPEIKDTLKRIQNAAKDRGWVRNWLGRRYYFSDPKWAYKAPNHLIQGGAAEVIKVAMNRVDEYLKDKESKLLLSIHDELIIEVRYGEEYVIDEIKKIMETVYPSNRLPLLVEIEYSFKNLADKESWPPPQLSNGTETGDQVQANVKTPAGQDSARMV